MSRLRAEQTDIWHVKAAEQTPNNNENLKYDALKIREFMREAKSHNQAWEEWFEQNDINPHILVYEDLISSPDRHIKDILKFLDISIKDNISIKSENKKMSDDLSLKWIEKFKSEEL